MLCDLKTTLWLKNPYAGIIVSVSRAVSRSGRTLFCLHSDCWWSEKHCCKKHSRSQEYNFKSSCVGHPNFSSICIYGIQSDNPLTKWGPLQVTRVEFVRSQLAGVFVGDFEADVFNQVRPF